MLVIIPLFVTNFLNCMFVCFLLNYLFLFVAMIQLQICGL